MRTCRKSIKIIRGHNNSVLEEHTKCISRNTYPNTTTVVMSACEALDERVVGNGLDEPTVASSCETSTMPAAARAIAPIGAVQSPVSAALPAPLARQAHQSLSFFSYSSCRILASQAWAIIDNVMYRYQLCQKRTSYSSSPVSHLASSIHCSIV
jgi:hypothetical protein